MSDGEINDKYSSQENRILTEINREKLPSFAEALKKKGYMNVQPVYQRRPRWDAKMKSRLIESFLINIPVPPIILFEEDYNSYEVMDGQQRITAIREFYENKLKLTGLELRQKSMDVLMINFQLKLKQELIDDLFHLLLLLQNQLLILK